MLKKPLVLTDGRLEQLQVGDTLAPTPNVIEVVNGETVTLFAPAVVYLSAASTVNYAQANAELTTQALGLCVTDILSGNTGLIQINGILSLPTVTWDLATGETGGLTPGAIYFLSFDTIGSIRQIAPSAVGDYVVEIGRGINLTDFEIKISTPIKL